MDISKIFEKKKKQETPEEKKARVAEVKKELATQVIKRNKYGAQIKKIVDQATAEKKALREEAVAALERGDELEAQFLCSQIKIKQIAITRNTNMYLLNLKIAELLGQKQIFLETLDFSTEFDLGNDLITSEEIDKITSDLRALDVDIEMWTQNIEKLTQDVGTNEIFDELVKEVQRKNGLGEIDGMTVGDSTVTQTNGSSVKI